MSIVADCHQHAGEASYIRGLLKARAKVGPVGGPDAPGPAGGTEGRPQEAQPVT